ncbi:MAG: pilin [Candidatus Shapirobacteria bacterium]|nr:pilin [Candidatus Shapirobacteria bacterium]
MTLTSFLTGVSVLAQDDSDVHQIQDIEEIVSRLLGLVVPFVGILLLLMLIAGGFQYITSGGETEQAQKAKKTLTYAFFGLVVVLGAWLIIRLLEEFTGLNLTTFQIPR